MHHMLEQQHDLHETDMLPPRPGLHALLEEARGAHSVILRSRQAGQHQYRLAVNADMGSIVLSRDADEHIEGSGTEVTVQLTADHAGGTTVSSLRAAIARHCGGMASKVRLNGAVVECHEAPGVLPTRVHVKRVLSADLNVQGVDEAKSQHVLAGQTSSDSEACAEKTGASEQGGETPSEKALEKSWGAQIAVQGETATPTKEQLGFDVSDEPQIGTFETEVSVHSVDVSGIGHNSAINVETLNKNGPATAVLLDISSVYSHTPDSVAVIAGGRDSLSGELDFMAQYTLTKTQAHRINDPLVVWWSSSYPFPAAQVQCQNGHYHCHLTVIFKTFKPSMAECPPGTFQQNPHSPLYYNFYPSPTSFAYCASPDAQGRTTPVVSSLRADSAYFRTFCKQTWACQTYAPSSTPQPTPSQTATPPPTLCTYQQLPVYPAQPYMYISGYDSCPPRGTSGLFTCTQEQQPTYKMLDPRMCSVSCPYGSGIVCKPEQNIYPSPLTTPSAQPTPSNTPTALATPSVTPSSVPSHSTLPTVSVTASAALIPPNAAVPASKSAASRWFHDSTHQIILGAVCGTVGVLALFAYWWTRGPAPASRRQPIQQLPATQHSYVQLN